MWTRTWWIWTPALNVALQFRTGGETAPVLSAQFDWVHASWFQLQYSTARLNKEVLNMSRKRICYGKTDRNSMLESRLRSDGQARVGGAGGVSFGLVHKVLSATRKAGVGCRCRTAWMRISCRCWCILSRVIRCSHLRLIIPGCIRSLSVTGRMTVWWNFSTTWGSTTNYVE